MWLILSRFFSSTFYMDQLAKFCQDQWNEHLEISKIAEFGRYRSLANTDVASQSREILHTFVWGGGGGGHVFCIAGFSLASPQNARVYLLF